MPKWWQKYDVSKLWIASSQCTPESTPAASSSAPVKNITSTTETTVTTNMSHQLILEIPVPYKSPGPYLVEYPYEYHFVINAPNNRADRDIIRNTWGGESPVLDKVVKVFFLLGLRTGDGVAELQEKLLQESKEHRDLIQSDFLDCYKNLTIKTMVMMEWLDKYCSQAAYAMKIDSDMFLNLPNLISMLSNTPKTNYLTGLVAKGSRVSRDQGSKWYLPQEVYPNPRYPPYALGLGYVLSLDLPKKLVEASRHVKAVYIEDVYLEWCMKHLGIFLTYPPDWGYFHVVPVPYSRCAYSKIIATTTKKDQDRMTLKGQAHTADLDLKMNTFLPVN
ncbi:Beta-1,3-galactosyltransferase 2 [Collichthys lucidus]|uniref:Hexosyltransferase n=1 Tax=Collichthys lucidus TaxID=240159 RepID=A0A4U5UBA9_COLLU|nr:Beta-1,3-galactosyltransferase 2 [Collichthys lucidus]